MLGSSPIWTNTPSSSTGVRLVGGAVRVDEAGHLVAVAHHLGGQRATMMSIWEAASLVCSTASARSFGSNSTRVTLHHAGEVDGRLHTGVSAADHGDALALEQRAVAVGAERDALVAILRPRPARSSNASARPVERMTVLAAAPLARFTVVRPPGLVAGKGGAPLQVHHVDVVPVDVLPRARWRAWGSPVHRTRSSRWPWCQHLAAEALGGDAGADPMRAAVDGRGGRTGGATADDQRRTDPVGDPRRRACRRRCRAWRRSARGSCAPWSNVAPVQEHRRHPPALVIDPSRTGP